MKPGQRVSHPAFGAGIVRAVNLTGPRPRAHVDFGYTRAWVVLEALEVLESAPTPEPDSAEPCDPPTDNPTQWTTESPPATAGRGGDRTALSPFTRSETEARKGITALRLGQVLEAQALQLSVGTDALQVRLQQALARALSGRPTLLLIDGAWGGGKTHALTLLQALARSQGMATSSTVMDGIAVTLSEPMQLMESITSSLRLSANSSDDGIGHLLRAAKLEKKLGNLRAHGAHEIADALDRLPERAFDDPEALQCIEDYFAFSLSTTQVRRRLDILGYEAAAPPVLRARWVAERPKAFAVMLKCWAQTMAVMGSKGLLIVIDELDVEYASTAATNRTSGGLRARRRAMLEQVSGLSAHNAPLLLAFASAPAGPDVESENDAVEDIREAIGPGLVHLKVANPSPDDLKQLLGKLAGLYEAAYPAQPLGITGQRASQLFAGLHARYRQAPSPVPRHFVRTALESFDLLTVGARPFEDVLRLLKA